MHTWFVRHVVFMLTPEHTTTTLKHCTVEYGHRIFYQSEASPAPFRFTFSRTCTALLIGFTTTTVLGFLS